MDERTQQAVEATVADELLRNERIIEHQTFGLVRLKRPTAHQERMIAEVRRKQYQADLKNRDVLSRDEIEQIAVERGMWSADISDRMTDLTRRVGEAMGILDGIGFKSLSHLLEGYQTNVTELLGLFAEQPEIQDVVRAYYNLDVPQDAKDRAKILDSAPSTRVDDLIDQGETLRVQIELLHDMAKVRTELERLRMKETRLFLDSLESRADRAEELARVYYCSTKAATGEPLYPSFDGPDGILHADPSETEVLVLKMAYFVNGVTPEFEEVLGRFGFTRRLTDTGDSSEGSHGQPESNSVGDSQESESSPSSEPSE